MTDGHLEHMCKLSAITASMILDPDFDVREHGCVTASEAHNLANGYRILAETFVELQRRQGISPKFRVRVAA